LREAKLETSWVRPNAAYEAACLQFVDDILDEQKSAAFRRRLEALAERLRPAAAVNSLAALALKATAPGFPDFYQGAERTTDSLTDPDNRRPVDFDALAAMLGRLGERPPPVAFPDAKPWLTRRLLEIRERHRDVLSEGGYAPLAVSGRMASHVFAFRRGSDNGQLVVVLPR